jgi:hypothetical protein
VDDDEIRAALVRHWEYSGRDEVVAHEIYHDDAVLEFPQSGERFVGVDNFREWRQAYPARTDFQIRRMRGSGDFWVSENSISYDGGPWWQTVSIMALRDGRIIHEAIYIMEPWDAPEWRKPWRASED